MIIFPHLTIPHLTLLLLTLRNLTSSTLASFYLTSSLPVIHLTSLHLTLRHLPHLTSLHFTSPHFTAHSSPSNLVSNRQSFSPLLFHCRFCCDPPRPFLSPERLHHTSNTILTRIISSTFWHNFYSTLPCRKTLQHKQRNCSPRCESILVEEQPDFG